MSCQTLPIVLLADAKPQDFCCPSFQLLLQVCRHFDAEPRLDTRGSSGMQYRFSCPVLLEVSRTPEEETEEDISLKLFKNYFLLNLHVNTAPFSLISAVHSLNIEEKGIFCLQPLEPVVRLGQTCCILR